MRIYLMCFPNLLFSTFASKTSFLEKPYESITLKTTSRRKTTRITMKSPENFIAKAAPLRHKLISGTSRGKRVADLSKPRNRLCRLPRVALKESEVIQLRITQRFVISLLFSLSRMCLVKRSMLHDFKALT